MKPGLGLVNVQVRAIHDTAVSSYTYGRRVLQLLKLLHTSTLTEVTAFRWARVLKTHWRKIQRREKRYDKRGSGVEEDSTMSGWLQGNEQEVPTTGRKYTGKENSAQNLTLGSNWPNFHTVHDIVHVNNLGVELRITHLTGQSVQIALMIEPRHIRHAEVFHLDPFKYAQKQENNINPHPFLLLRYPLGRFLEKNTSSECDLGSWSR